MSMIGLALVATLSISPPDSSTEAPVIVVAPPAPAATEAPPVVVVAPAPAPATPPPSPIPVPSTIPRKPLAGVGLIAASATSFIIGLSAQITTAASQANYCQNWDERGFNTVHGCFYLTEPWQVHAGTGYAFGTSMVLAGIGAGALGQYDAWQTVYGDGRTRNARARIFTGAVLTGLGIGAFIAEGILLRRELTDYCTTHECEVQRRKLYYGLADAGALSLTAGVGLLSHGRNYRKNLRRYSGLQNWSLTPTASPRMLGASASLRF